MDENCDSKDFEKLQHIVAGHIFFQTLSAGIEFDLFSKLDKKEMNLSEICRELNIEEKPGKILILGLVAIEVLKKKGDHYCNSEMAKTYLSSQSPKNIINIIRWQHHINYKPMFHFHEALKQNTNVGLMEILGPGNNLYQRLTEHPHLEKIFQDAMREISIMANQHFVDAVDFSQVKHLIDVGGGNGSNIIKLAEKYPNMKASVFDSKSVCQKALVNIKAHGLEKRLSAIAGNIFEDELPENLDAIIFCHFFTIWDKESNLKLLKKAYNAIEPGGRVLIFNMMQNDEGDGPLNAAIGSPYFLTLATGLGMIYSWNDYLDIFKKAGFTKTDVCRLPHNHGVIIGHKPDI